MQENSAKRNRSMLSCTGGFAFMALFMFISPCNAQNRGTDREMTDTIALTANPTGWADESVTIGWITAPASLGLMFVSALVNEWNSGIAGIPASALILAAPPLIYAGGRSAALPREYASSRASLGWTLWALSLIPTSIALYEFSTDWGATIPLTIASGVLGSASILAMTSYAFSRKEAAMALNSGMEEGWNIQISPLPGGVLATLSCRF